MEDYRFGRRSKMWLYGNNNKVAVNRPTQRLCERVLKESTIDFGIIDGYRTDVKQNRLFKRGMSTLDGYIKKSDHQSGNAVDVIPVVRSKDGKKLNPFHVHLDEVKLAWLELYRAFMRASFKEGITIEFGFGYNIGKGRDWPHISVKGIR